MAQLTRELKKRNYGESGLLTADRLPFCVESNDRGAAQSPSHVSELGRVGGGDKVDLKGFLGIGIHGSSKTPQFPMVRLKVRNI